MCARADVGVNYKIKHRYMYSLRIQIFFLGRSADFVSGGLPTLLTQEESFRTYHRWIRYRMPCLPPGRLFDFRKVKQFAVRDKRCRFTIV